MTRSMPVPRLSPEAIESAVGELRRAYHKKRGREARPPVPIDDIVEFHLGLDFRMDDLHKLLGFGDVLGATWFEEQRIIIDRRLEDQEGRYAFTLAHEVGHWILHRPLYEMEKAAPMLIPREASKPLADVICRSSASREPAEWQADQFAARLLMPAADVRATVTTLRASAEVTRDIDASESRDEAALRRVARAVIETGAFSNVSNEAMRIRLQQLDIIRTGAALRS